MKKIILCAFCLLFTVACKSTKQSLKVTSKVVADSASTKTANASTKSQTLFYGDTLSGISIIPDTASVIFAESKGLKLSFTLQPQSKRIRYTAISKPTSITNSHVAVKATERTQATQSTLTKTESKIKTSWLSPVWLLHHALWLIALIVCYVLYKRYFN